MTGVRVLLAGSSTRAAAASAARAGFAVTALDRFGDLDQHPAVRALSMPRDFGSRGTASAMARVARNLQSDAVVYLSPFENHPVAVERLARGRALWGNPPSVLRAVRDPLAVARRLGARACAVAAVRTATGASRAAGLSGATSWLRKPLASGGGHGIARWRGGQAPPRGSYLQEEIAGVSGSVTFIAADGACAPLGVSRQLIGDPAFGARPFRYCGNILAAPEAGLFTPGVHAAAERLARMAAEEFGLTGVNGIDFVLRGDEPVLVEINPRWTASLEVVERRAGIPLFALHAEACAGHRVPSSAGVIPAATGATGKAILYARAAVTTRDTQAWLEDGDVGDVPRPGERMGPGDPICSVFATGRDEARCYDALVAKAEWIYGSM